MIFLAVLIATNINKCVMPFKNVAVITLYVYFVAILGKISSKS